MTNFRQISPKHRSNNDKRKCVGKFWQLKYLLRPFTQHDSQIFSYSNFRCRYLQSQSKYRKSLTSFLWLMPCEWDCAAIFLVLQHPIPDKLNRRIFGRFTPYRLLTLSLKKKKSLKLYFYRNLHLVSFLLICSLLGF